MYTRDNWEEFLKERDRGEQVETDEATYWYFLEVLPPVGMPYRAKFADGTERRVDFGFAEGREFVTGFWTEGRGDNKKYFCRLTTQLNPWW